MMYEGFCKIAFAIKGYNTHGPGDAGKGREASVWGRKSRGVDMSKPIAEVLVKVSCLRLSIGRFTGFSRNTSV
jgi:hypothetical protein